MSTNQSYNEQGLLSRIAEGDESAFRQLYDLHEPLVYGTALSYLKSPDWARDIVQDIFLKIWLKRIELRKMEKPEDFLFIMTRNEVLNALRRKFDTVTLGDYYEDALPADLLLPDARLQLRQTHATIQQAVEQLPDQQKRVYILSREQGLSHEQIAEQLGIDKRTVSNHATRALNNIRIFLKNHGENLLSLFF